MTIKPRSCYVGVLVALTGSTATIALEVSTRAASELVDLLVLLQSDTGTSTDESICLDPN